MGSKLLYEKYEAIKEDMRNGAFVTGVDLIEDILSDLGDLPDIVLGRPKQGDTVLAGTNEMDLEKQSVLGFTDDGKIICICDNKIQIFNYWEEIK